MAASNMEQYSAQASSSTLDDSSVAGPRPHLTGSSISSSSSYPPVSIAFATPAPQPGRENATASAPLLIGEASSRLSLPLPRLERPSSFSSSIVNPVAPRLRSRYRLPREIQNGRSPETSRDAQQVGPFPFYVHTASTRDIGDLAISPFPPDPDISPGVIISHRAGLDPTVVYLEEAEYQLCEDARLAQRLARRRATKIVKSNERRQADYPDSSIPSSAFSGSSTPAVDNLTPATTLSHAPQSPPLNSDLSMATAPVPKQPSAPAWSRPRTWDSLAAKNSGAVSFTISEPSHSSTSSAGPRSSHGTSHAQNGRSSGHANGVRSSSRSLPVSLAALLAEVHNDFSAPLTLPRGLINTGNYCFANAILQVLVFCGPFYNLFATVGRELAADLANTTPLMEAVVQFLREFHISKRASGGAQGGGLEEVLAADPSLSEPFVPEFVYDAMRLNKRFDLMRRGHQEDAEEFLGFFLDTLHEELLSAISKSRNRLLSSNLFRRMSPQEKKLNGLTDEDIAALQGFDDDEEEEREVTRPISPSEQGWMEVGQKGKTAFTRTTSTAESPITRIFGGKLRSVLRTPGAKDSVTLEPYQPLQLDIQPSHVSTVEEALLNLTAPETIPGVYSPARGGLVDATKQVFIERTPPVLILHLKRFLYDEVGGVQKNGKEIGYKDSLEVGGEMVSPSRRIEPPARYRLFGVVYHHGRYASGGHYTVDVMRQDGSGWIHFDDTLFNAVAPEHVGRRPGHLSKDVGHDGAAYLLFYRREDPTTAATSVNALPNGHNHGGKAIATPSTSRAPSTSAPAHGVNGHSRASSSSGGLVSNNRFETPHNGQTTPSESVRANSLASSTAQSKQKPSPKGQSAIGAKKGPKMTNDNTSDSVKLPPQPPQPRQIPGAAAGKTRLPK